jgi:hypothetical protein
MPHVTVKMRPREKAATALLAGGSLVLASAITASGDLARIRRSWLRARAWQPRPRGVARAAGRDRRHRDRHVDGSSRSGQRER